MFSIKVLEKMKTHFVFSNSPPWKLCHLWDNVQQYCRAGQATGDSVGYAHYMLDT